MFSRMFGSTTTPPPTLSNRFQDKHTQQYGKNREALTEHILDKAVEQELKHAKQQACFDEWKLYNRYGAEVVHDVIDEFKALKQFTVNHDVPKCQVKPHALDCENSLLCIEWEKLNNRY